MAVMEQSRVPIPQPICKVTLLHRVKNGIVTNVMAEKVVFFLTKNTINVLCVSKSFYFLLFKYNSIQKRS